VTINQATVRVKGPLGAHFELSVNGQRIADTQVGKKSSLEETGVLAWSTSASISAGTQPLERACAR